MQAIFLPKNIKATAVTNTMGDINLRKSLCCFVKSSTGPEIATGTRYKYFLLFNLLEPHLTAAQSTSKK
jgi:hypothetical protein